MNNLNSKTIYKCPVCELNLVKEEMHYICAKGHNYDISRKGNVNLLLANQKNTKDPGDSKEMIESRRDFLNKKYYGKFSDKLNEVIAFHLSEKSRYILDAGCGEGYFISKLKNKLSAEKNRENLNYYGIDISKAAINYASRRDKSIYFAVGSNFNLPIMNNSVDCIVRNFAPSDNKEFYRVLRDNGKLVIITPGIEHLFELKEILYDKARKHELKDSSLDGFKCIDHQEIQYSIDLQNHEDTRNLISMTPYYWSITSDMRSKIDNIDSFTTKVHFNIDVYCKDNI
jgi:23S rRNA (guanine745-N1)-methyltransferase